MYFKWDLFRRHIKKWVYVAKYGIKWLFLCMGKTHKYTNVRASVHTDDGHRGIPKAHPEQAQVS